MQSDFAPHTSYRSIEQDPPPTSGHLDDVVDCDEGYWRKRLLAFIQSMFVLLLILVGLNFFTGLTSGHFSLVPFFPLMFLWLVLYVGHIGAHKRRASFLHAYFILNVLIICFVLVTFILFPAVLGTILCALDGGYGGGCSWGEAKAIAHLTFIGFLFAFIPCFPAAMGAIYALRARNELLMAELRASVEAELGVRLDGRSSSADHQEHLGLLHARPVAPVVPSSPQQRYYYSCDYRPVVYMPNPPYFSSNGGGSGSQSQPVPYQHGQPVQFPAPPPTGYYYYPPPPPRSAGAPSAPSAPASSTPAAAGAATAQQSAPAGTMPPSVPQTSDGKQ